jgi:hypothetical protein
MWFAGAAVFGFIGELLGIDIEELSKGGRGV